MQPSLGLGLALWPELGFKEPNTHSCGLLCGLALGPRKKHLCGDWGCIVRRIFNLRQVPKISCIGES